MAIERRNVRVGSTLRGMLSPMTVTLPASDFTGIAPSQSIPVGNDVSVTGPMMVNGGTGAYSSYLRIPTAITIVKAANADKVVIQVSGLDHLGRTVREIISATDASCVTEGASRTVWSRIDRVTLTQGSAATMTFSLGVVYGCYGVTGGSFITVNNRARSIRQIPIPYLCRTADELIGIDFLGFAGGGGQVLSRSPVAGNITFSTANDVVATSSTAWDLSLVAIGDIAYVSGSSLNATNACIGVITSVTDASDTITVERWYSRGLAVDDLTNTVGNAAAGPQITILRNLVPVTGQTGSISSTFVGSMIPGQIVVPASQSVSTVGTLPDGTFAPATLHGHSLNSATFGFQSYITGEPVLCPEFRVLIAPANPY